MRKPRIVVKKGETGCYHCISKVVGGQYIFGRNEKRYFIEQMHRLAKFLGIKILEYSVLGNHYHQLIEVPGTVELTDAELAKRVRDYYGKRSIEATRMERALAEGGESMERIRKRYMWRMGNLSEFKKVLKHGFSRWYNSQNNREGTLWKERFKSVLVEDSPTNLQVFGIYISLNSIRAAIVKDPKDYPYCAYAAALAGVNWCREGILRVTGAKTWKEASSYYRKLMLTVGHRKASGKRGSVDRELLLKTLEENGCLPMSELVLLRNRFMSDGLVFGSREFVDEVFAQNRSKFAQSRKSGAQPIKQIADMDFSVAQVLRNKVII